MIQLIDTMHLGRDRVIAAHLVRDGLIVDPGPASALDNWIDRLERPPRALMLTHIHLDHAGASGVLAQRFEDLRIYVHEVGAAHLIDPEKLLSSASRLYGPENMNRMWGEVAPVPEERVVALSGGEEVEGFRVEHTPGHASHHVTYLDLASGDAFVGDMAGVRIPPYGLTLPPTPPPEVDVEAWLDSVRRIEALQPARLRLTHFDVASEPGPQLDAVVEALQRNAELARRGDRESFLAEVEGEIDSVADRHTAIRMRQAWPPEHQWLGLERYWRKQDEREAG
jgi:glyoxylase-like metal-dependent hydrolase (beta-lactamase superfamily II)